MSQHHLLLSTSGLSFCSSRATQHNSRFAAHRASSLSHRTLFTFSYSLCPSGDQTMPMPRWYGDNRASAVLSSLLVDDYVSPSVCWFLCTVTTVNWESGRFGGSPRGVPLFDWKDEVTRGRCSLLHVSTSVDPCSKSSKTPCDVSPKEVGSVSEHPG